MKARSASPPAQLRCLSFFQSASVPLTDITPIFSCPRSPPFSPERTPPLSIFLGLASNCPRMSLYLISNLFPPSQYPAGSHLHGLLSIPRAALRITPPRFA